MVLRDVLNNAIDLAGVPISDANFIKDYNRCVKDLTMRYDTAKKQTPQTIVCSDVSAQYALTSGCIGIKRVLDAGGYNFKSFSVYGNAFIVFAYTGTYTVDGLFEQTPITAMSSTISINTAYLTAIAEYIAARALRGVSPEYTTLAGKKVQVSSPDSYQDFMEHYRVDSANANANIRKTTNPNRRVYAPRFR